MEIVYVIEDFSIKGGAERIIAEKANYLASRFQHHVTIVSKIGRVSCRERV